MYVFTLTHTHPHTHTERKTRKRTFTGTRIFTERITLPYSGEREGERRAAAGLRLTDSLHPHTASPLFSASCVAHLLSSHPLSPHAPSACKYIHDIAMVDMKRLCECAPCAHVCVSVPSSSCICRNVKLLKRTEADRGTSQALKMLRDRCLSLLHLAFQLTLTSAAKSATLCNW